MVVVLVNLAVNYFLGLLVLCACDMLVDNGWVNSLMNGGVMLSVLGEE